MNAETLAGIAASFSGITLFTVLLVAFQAGRWMGRTDTRLDTIEEKIDSRPRTARK